MWFLRQSQSCRHIACYDLHRIAVCAWLFLMKTDMHQLLVGFQSERQAQWWSE